MRNLRKLQSSSAALPSSRCAASLSGMQPFEAFPTDQKISPGCQLCPCWRGGTYCKFEINLAGVKFDCSWPLTTCPETSNSLHPKLQVLIDNVQLQNYTSGLMSSAYATAVAAACRHVRISVMLSILGMASEHGKTTEC